MFVKKYTSWPFNLLLIFIACGVFLAMQSIIAAWNAPTCNPESDPGSCNISTPINVGPDIQDKLGSLILRDTLMLHDTNLLFKDAGNVNGISILAPSPLSVDYTLTLPDSLPSDADIMPYFLTTDSLGSLYWSNLRDANTQDEDWDYVGASPTWTAIFSRWLTRIGAYDTNLDQLTDGGSEGDLYVQDELEVDGTSYLANVLINGATFDSVYALNVSGDSHFAGNIIIDGNILPGVSGTYNLGAIDNRWSNVYAENINTTNLTVTTLNTNFLQGSVIFQGAGQLDENNGNLFWDNSTNSLGIGTDGPLGPLHVASSLNLLGNVSGLNANTISGSSTSFTTQAVIGDNIVLKEDYDDGEFVNVLHKAPITAVNTNNSVSVDYNFYSESPWAAESPNYTIIRTVLLQNSDLRFENAFNAPTAIYFGDETFIHNAGSTTVTDEDGVAGPDGINRNTNTYIGLSAGAVPVDIYNSSVAYYNSAMGYRSLANNSTGKNNSGFGALSLLNNSTGYSNTAVGTMSLQKNTIGYENTAVGYRALLNNTGSDFNVAIGVRALEYNTGDKNTAIGRNALQNNGSGYGNVAIGYQTLMNNSTGFYNLALGQEAGFYTTTAGNTDGNAGTYNTLLGWRAGYGRSNSESGYNNVAIGKEAGYNNGGRANVSIGPEAGRYNISGEYNTFIGNQAGYNVASGLNNVAIGNQAGRAVSSGSGNIFLGNQAGFDETGTATLYINNFTDTGAPNIPDKRLSLLYGEFYSPGLHETPLLRVNGNVGISKMLEDYTPDSLLHLYQTVSTSPNPEIKIQANAKVAGNSFQEHWGMYQDRVSKELRFWNDRGDNYYSGGTGTQRTDLDNVLSLAIGTASPWGGRVGINTSNPQGTLEIHDGINGMSTLNLSSYDDVALGSTSGTRGSAAIEFRVGRVNPANGIYQIYPSGSIFSSYMPLGDGSYPDQYRNAAVAIRTVNDSGDLNSSTLIARHDQVGIAGDIDDNRTFMVHGATRSDDYHSGDDSQGATTKSCLAFLNISGNPAHAWLCFKDGLFIDICSGTGGTCNCVFTAASGCNN